MLHFSEDGVGLKRQLMRSGIMNLKNLPSNAKTTH